MGQITYKEHTFYTSVHESTPNNRLIVSTSDGLTLFQDCVEGKPHFWKRLKEYIENSEVRITKVRYQVGRYMLDVPDHRDWYYYIERQEGELGGQIFKSIKLGYSDDGEKVLGFQYGELGNSQICEDFRRCSLGIIDNR